MRLAAVLTCLAGATLTLLTAPDPDRNPGKAPEAPKGFDTFHRVLWDQSHVVRSPSPPPPSRVRQTSPRLKVACPIAVRHEPGTQSLLLVHQHTAWSGAGRILRVPDEPDADKAETLLDVDGIAYGVAFHPD